MSSSGGAGFQATNESSPEPTARLDASEQRVARADSLDLHSKKVALSTAKKAFRTAREAFGTAKVHHSTAWVGLLAAIIGGSGTVLTLLAVTDEAQSKPLAAPSKPLEGEWEFSIVYDKFHGEQGTWSGKGRGLFVWNKERAEYRFWHGADVFRQGELKDPVLTTFSLGYVRANADGWPSPPFDIVDIRYIARMHVDGRSPTMTVSSYTKCALDGDRLRPDVIHCDFDTGRSHAVVRMKLVASLH